MGNLYLAYLDNEEVYRGGDMDASWRLRKRKCVSFAWYRLKSEEDGVRVEFHRKDHGTSEYGSVFLRGSVLEALADMKENSFD